MAPGLDPEKLATLPFPDDLTLGEAEIIIRRQLADVWALSTRPGGVEIIFGRRQDCDGQEELMPLDMTLAEWKACPPGWTIFLSVSDEDGGSPVAQPVRVFT